MVSTQKGTAIRLARSVGLASLARSGGLGLRGPKGPGLVLARGLEVLGCVLLRVPKTL